MVRLFTTERNTRKKKRVLPLNYPGKTLFIIMEQTMESENRYPQA